MIGVKHKWSQHRSYNDMSTHTSCRHVAIHQKRTSQDYPVWNWLLNIFKPSATQDYILVGKTSSALVPFIENGKIRTLSDTQGVLFGSVFVVPYQDDVEFRWEKENFLKNVHTLMEPTSNSPDAVCDQIEALVNRAKEAGILVHNFQYALFRTGEVRIWSNVSDALGFASDQSNLNIDEKVIAERLPRQVYYFIKEAAHSHYHHEPDSDQLLPLVKQFPLIGPDLVETHSENELRWRREILWGLARVLAKYRREGNIKQLKRAQGILAYAEAFQATLARVKRPIDVDEKPTLDVDITTYDFAHTKQSVSALEGLRTWQNSGNLQIIAAVVAVLFSASTFWSASIRIVDGVCSPSATLLKESFCNNYLSHRALTVAAWVSRHPLVFLGWITIPLIIAYSMFVKDIKDFRFARKPARFISAITRVIAATIARRFGNPILGFASSLSLLATVLIFLIWLFYKIGGYMQNS